MEQGWYLRIVKDNKITWKLQTRFDWVCTWGIMKKCSVHPSCPLAPAWIARINDPDDGPDKTSWTVYKIWRMSFGQDVWIKTYLNKEEEYTKKKGVNKPIYGQVSWEQHLTKIFHFNKWLGLHFNDKPNSLFNIISCNIQRNLMVMPFVNCHVLDWLFEICRIFFTPRPGKLYNIMKCSYEYRP
jgi:hypothetical protein